MSEKPQDAATLQYVMHLVEEFTHTADAGGAMEEKKLSPEALARLQQLKEELEPQERYILVCEEVAAAMRSLHYQLQQLYRDAPPPNDVTPVINTLPPLVAFRDESIEIAQEAFEEADPTDPNIQVREINDGSKVISLVFGDKSPILHPHKAIAKPDLSQYRRTVMIPNAPTFEHPEPQLRGWRAAWAAFLGWFVAS
jgi:hypothetical protein